MKPVRNLKTGQSQELQVQKLGFLIPEVMDLFFSVRCRFLKSLGPDGKSCAVPVSSVLVLKINDSDTLRYSHDV